MTSDVSEVTDDQIKKLARENGAFHAGDMRGLILCENKGFEGGLVGFARALLAAQPAVLAVPGWRPIESAPKDGTRILLTDGTSVTEGSYYNIPASIDVRRDLDGRYIDQIEDDGFEGWMDSLGGIGPTHYMPLPAAPAIHEGGEG